MEAVASVLIAVGMYNTKRFHAVVLHKVHNGYGPSFGNTQIH